MKHGPPTKYSADPSSSWICLANQIQCNPILYTWHV